MPNRSRIPPLAVESTSARSGDATSGFPKPRNGYGDAMIDGDGNPITMRELEDTILRTLKSNGELDISDLRYLLA